MKKKIIALCLVAVLALTAIGGTLAYFTDTDEAENVFIVGNIDIELHERVSAEVQWTDNDDYQDWLDDQTILPGQTLPKVVNVKNVGGNDAYVRVTITYPENITLDLPEVEGWTCVNENGKAVWTATAPLAPGAETPVLLNNITLGADVTELDALSAYQVDVYVDAIQAVTFADAAEAYAALDSAYVADKETAANMAEINTALQSGNSVVSLTGDVTSNDGVVMPDGGVIDGNGNEIITSGNGTPTNDAALYTNSGTIKNVTITKTDSGNNFGIYNASPIEGDIIVDNVTVNAYRALYIVPGGSNPYTLTVNNSNINGKMAVSGIAQATVNAGSIIGKDINASANLTLNGVKLGSGTDEKQVLESGGNVTIILNNCSVGETLITAENIATQLDMSTLKNVTVVVNGTTIAY